MIGPPPRTRWTFYPVDFGTGKRWNLNTADHDAAG